MELLVQNGEGLPEIQTSLPQHTERDSRLLHKRLGPAPGLGIDVLQPQIISVQPDIGRVLVEVSRGFVQPIERARLYPVAAAERVVLCIVIHQILMKTGTEHFRAEALLQKNIDLMEQREQEQSCNVRMTLQKLLESVHVVDRICQNDAVLQRRIAEVMNLGAEFTDSDHVAFPELIGSPRIFYQYLSLSNHVKCSHRLTAAVNAFSLF